MNNCPFVGPAARPNPAGVITNHRCFPKSELSQHLFEALLIGPPPGDLILARLIASDVEHHGSGFDRFRQNLRYNDCATA